MCFNDSLYTKMITSRWTEMRMRLAGGGSLGDGHHMTHCRASGGMAIFLGVSAAPERILLSKISYAPVQHSSLHQKVLL